MNSKAFSIIVYCISFFSLFWGSCANIVPPSGGDRDTTLPKLLKIVPGDSSLNIFPKKITATFDKYMVVENVGKEFTISPLISLNPTILANMKRVIITFPDSIFLPNTTYQITTGNAIKDNRENNVYKNLTYTFSTGSYFDSLMIKGFAFNAYNHLVDSNYIAVLYDTTKFTDSQLFKSKPLYMSRLNNDGSFQINNLPNKPFQLFVIKDKTKDLVYNPGRDEIGFISDVVYPSQSFDDSMVILTSRELVDTTNDGQTEVDSVEMRRSMRSKSKAIFGYTLKEDEQYKVFVDTNAAPTQNQELTDPLRIMVKSTFGKLDSSKIFLSFDKEGAEIESITSISIKDSVINLSTEWQENTKYTLRLMKGWAVDSTGKEFLPSKYSFQTKKVEDYGTITVTVSDTFLNKNYHLILETETDSIANIKILQSVNSFKLLKPGKYNIRIFNDVNNDGVWTPADYLSKRYAEPVLNHASVITLRAGWENEETFNPKPIGSNSKSNRMQQSADMKKED